MTFNETLERQKSRKLRKDWCDAFLPGQLDYIEALVTQELKLVFPALAASASEFRLAYEKRDPTLIPTCFRHGSYNVVFFLKHEIGRVVLRLPFPDRMLAAEAYRKEFAILCHLRDNTTIPVPEPLVMGYDDVLNSSYLILSDVGGFRLDYLATSWQGIPPNKLESVRHQLAQILTSLLQQNFDAIGALDILEGGLKIARPIFGEGNGLFDSFFDVEWSSQSAMTSSNELYDFIQRVHTRIWHEQEDFEAEQVRRKGESIIKLEYQSRQAFAKLLDAWKERMKPADQLGYRLQHPDFRAGNILVDPRTWTITGVIDWEFACIVPLALYRLPTFSNLGELIHGEDDWWRTYRTDSVGLLDLAGIEPELKDHFTSLSEIDFLVGFQLMSLMPSKLVPSGLLMPLFRARSSTIDDQGIIEIQNKFAQVQSALSELSKVFTDSELEVVINDDSEQKYSLGSVSRHVFGIACATPLPKSDDCT